jgi:hypothetical protein
MHVSKLHETMLSGKPCKRFVAMTSTFDGLRQMATDTSVLQICTGLPPMVAHVALYYMDSIFTMSNPPIPNWMPLKELVTGNYANQLGVKESRDRYENLDYHFIRDGKKYFLSSHTLLSVRTFPGTQPFEHYYRTR